jgi:hypothetical protein
MKVGVVPSDGHLQASRALSPYGAADNPELLKQWNVHFGIGDNTVLGSDRASYALERWWTLYIEALGGELATYSADTSIAIYRALQDAPAPSHQFAPEDTKRLQMLHIIVKDERNPLPVQERPLTVTPLAETQVRNAENVTIGLSWTCACDLDLYARAHSSADILFFGNRETIDGKYYQDVRGRLRSGQKGTASNMETIIYASMIDLRKLQVAVAYYSGKATNNITGTLHIGIGDKTYARNFTIFSPTGNKTNQIRESFEANKARAKHIFMFNPIEIVERSLSPKPD